MGDSIRSLTVKLGYDVDTTGANIFKGSFKNLKRELNRAAGTGGFEKAFLANLARSGERIKKRSSRIFAGIAVAIAVAFAAATKAFTGFATKEQAEISLERRVGKTGLEKAKESAEATQKATGKIVKDVELLNAIAQGFDLTGDLDFILKILPVAVKESKILGKSLSETMAILVGAAKGNLEAAIPLGFSTAQLEQAKERAGVKGKDFGLETGKALVLDLISRTETQRAETFLRFTKGANAALDKVKVSANEVSNALGERLAPTVNNVVTGMDQSLTRLKDTLDKGGSVTDAWLNSFQSDAARSFINLFRDKPLNQLSQNANGNNNKTENNITIIVNESKDAKATAEEVMRKQNEAVINSSMGKTETQSLETSIQPQISR